MTFNYRFSVIPAGAIIDARLTPRALQVLCLLGRHTNDQGWCSRSQVKMAKELGCGRSTIYDALELLYECEWVQKRANGRGTTPAEASEQPFAAYSYRVILDREAMPETLNSTSVQGSDSASSDAEKPAEGGAAQAAGGAGIAAGGAAPEPAPLEGTPSEGISTEPERDRARAREKATGLVTFEARWPTAAADDRNRTQYAWDALSEAERQDALNGIAPFLASLKRHKRDAVPAGWKYLEQKRWTLLDQKTSSTPQFIRATIDSEAGKAWWAINRVAHNTPLIVDGTYFIQRELTPQELAFAQAPPESEWLLITADQSKQCGAWNEFLGNALRGKTRPQLVWNRNPGSVMGFKAPWSWPPLKDGTIPQPTEQQRGE